MFVSPPSTPVCKLWILSVIKITHNVNSRVSISFRACSWSVFLSIVVRNCVLCLLNTRSGFQQAGIPRSNPQQTPTVFKTLIPPTVYPPPV
ncbi:hypothetical protein L1887_02487 [Cichorium endivia]|nr:hypothetical protein L1887_02487 [Cichorium endivia]